MRSENFLSCCCFSPYFIVQISQCTFFLLLRLFSEEEPNVSNGANLASTITTFQKMERKETWTHCDDPGWFSGFRTFMFPIAASLNKNRDFLAGFSSSSFLSKGSGFELWWLFYGKRASFYFAATAFFLLAVQWRRTFYHQDLYVTRWFLTKLLSRFRPPYVRGSISSIKEMRRSTFLKAKYICYMCSYFRLHKKLFAFTNLKSPFYRWLPICLSVQFQTSKNSKAFYIWKSAFIEKKVFVLNTLSLQLEKWDFSIFIL